MKTIFAFMLCIAGSVAMAQGHCDKSEAKACGKKVEAKQSGCEGKSACGSKVEAKQSGCEGKSACCGKVEAKQSGCEGKSACGGKVEAKQSGCGTKVCAEDEFMAEAHRMMMSAEGKTQCCKSTASKPMAKGDKGCCNAKGEPAKFKVFVAGEGYKYFGCEGSAGKGRKELAANGKRVGNIQKVTSKATAMR